MMKNEKTSSFGNNRGVGFCSILALIFITLKLLGRINWPWVWVVSPLWITISIGILVFAIVYIKLKIKGTKSI